MKAKVLYALAVLLVTLQVASPSAFAQEGEPTPVPIIDGHPAATLIDDFDTGYAEEGIHEQWWMYTDDLPDVTLFEFDLDHDVTYNGNASMRIDVDVAPGGYAGCGFDYGIPRDWTDGEGVIFQMRASQVGVPLSFVLHISDPTQTSSLSPGMTPFGYKFETPPGSDSDWVTVFLPWDGFEREWWVGQEGVTVFTPNPIVKVEVAFENHTNERLSATIWIDDIRVVSEEDLNAPPAFEELLPPIPPIHVSQAGYRPGDRKFFVATVPVDRFTIVDAGTGEVVYRGRAVRWGFDEDSQQEIYWGRFHSLDVPGTYRVVIEGIGESYPFVIADDAFSRPTLLAARAFYLQRSGIEINDAEISGLEHRAGHVRDARLWDDPEGPALDVTGGWYDAGDFGRYMPTAAFAVGQLMHAYTVNPDFFADGVLSIPESGNGVPDLLDEIRWELEWMLKMQREDGAVYHKVTTRSYPTFGIMPNTDVAPLYVFGPTTADTAYFAAAMAQASSIYAEYDPEFSATCMDAAERAWGWLQEHPEQVPPGGFRNPPPSEYPMQGGYDFYWDETDHRLWAAAELFRATGDADYETAFAEYLEQVPQAVVHHMSWAESYPMALFAYLTADGANPELRARVRDEFLAEADAILEVTFQSGYSVSLHGTEGPFAYVWGSNQVALANGLHLMMANEIAPNERYVHAALAQLQYIFGINPFAKMYMTGFGSDPVLHPHHSMSYGLQRALPGFVTEGANGTSSGGDAVLEALWEAGVPTALCYADDWDSWATNEPTIDANATFVALAAYFVPGAR